MLASIKDSVTDFSVGLFSGPNKLFSYNVVLYGAAITAVVAVAYLGVTTLTLTMCFVLPAAAGIYNAYFNNDDV